LRKDEKQVFRGITSWRNESPNALVVRLHYSASPEKDPATPEGAKWVEEGKKSAPSPEWWEQEQEIRFDARQGARVYHAYKDDETQVVKPFHIPSDWTRYFVLDTHPRVAHAMLWCAVSPNDEHYAYREFWPSRVYGNGKPVPEDDDRYPIPWYASVIKYLESGKNPENGGKDEKIFRRIIDYSARGFGKDAQNPDSVDYQTLYENSGREIGHPLYFEDCVKDNEAAYQAVNEALRPLPTIGSDGNIVYRSKFRIFENLPELRWELAHNRLKMLAPHQADVKDPDFRVVEKKNNVSDCAKYYWQARPYFWKEEKKKSTWKNPVNR
jgi:hypothetical protein